MNNIVDLVPILKETLENTGFNHYELLYEGCPDVDQIIYKITR